MRRDVLERQEICRLVLSVDDIRRAKAESKLSVAVQMKGFRCLERNLDMIEAADVEAADWKAGNRSPSPTLFHFGHCRPDATRALPAGRHRENPRVKLAARYERGLEVKGVRL